MTALVATALPDAARPRTRGARWRARAMRSAVPSMATLLTTPAWHRADAATRADIARAAALLSLRPAIDREVRGGPLRALADAAGEPLFDAVCAHPLFTDDADRPMGDARMPLPADRAALDRVGRDLLDAADRGDAFAAACARCAATLIAVEVGP